MKIRKRGDRLNWISQRGDEDAFTTSFFDIYVRTFLNLYSRIIDIWRALILRVIASIDLTLHIEYT